MCFLSLTLLGHVVKDSGESNGKNNTHNIHNQFVTAPSNRFQRFLHFVIHIFQSIIGVVGSIAGAQKTRVSQTKQTVTNHNFQFPHSLQMIQHLRLVLHFFTLRLGNVTQLQNGVIDIFQLVVKVLVPLLEGLEFQLLVRRQLGTAPAAVPSLAGASGRSWKQKK